LQEEAGERKLVRSALSCEVAKLVGAVKNLSSLYFTNFVADFERMTPYIRELGKKQVVTSQSLEKIEDGKSDPTASNNPHYSILRFTPCSLVG